MTIREGKGKPKTGNPRDRPLSGAAILWGCLPSGRPRALTRLSARGTDLSSLAPIRDPRDLESLDCSDTQAGDLGPIAALTDLRKLDCSRCEPTSLPESILDLSALRESILFETTIPGIPNGVLSTGFHDNRLRRPRSRFADIAAGAETTLNVKPLLIGNGGVGKSRIARRSAGKPFDETRSSTHGIEIGRTVPPGRPEVRLRVWDFGGQDIYTRRPRPRPENEVRRLPVSDAALAASPCLATLHVGAKNGRGFEETRAKLADAAQWLRAPDRMGLPVIGAGRLRVQERLEATRDTRRLSTRAEFEAIREETGGVSSPADPAHWLDAEGAVIYRPGLMIDQIIPDRNRAPGATPCSSGRAGFTRKSGVPTGVSPAPFHPHYVWSDRTDDEQRLFIDLTRSRGIRSTHRKFDDEKRRGGEILATIADTLPPRSFADFERYGLRDLPAPVEA